MSQSDKISILIIIVTIIFISIITWLAFKHEKKHKKFYEDNPLMIKGLIARQVFRDRFSSYIALTISMLVLIFLSIVGMGYGIPLFYYSIKMVYTKIHLWMKYGISIDVSTYACITSSSKYCTTLASSPPFNYVPPEFVRWIIDPKDWIGIHSIVKPLLVTPFWFIGLFISLIFFIPIISFISAIFNSASKDKSDISR